MGMLERPAPRVPEPGQATWGDTKWAKTFPLLSEYLGGRTYADGSARERGTIRLFQGDDGGWAAVLNDRDNDRSLWGNGASWLDVCAAFEAQLASPHPRWRYEAQRPSRGKGKGR